MVSEGGPDYALREASRERNREALLVSAAELLRERGYRSTSVTAVAERAGLTKGAVYSIFGSKFDLFNALREPQQREFALTHVAEPGTPLREALGAVGRYWAAFAGTPASRDALLLGFELALDILRDAQVSGSSPQPFEDNHVIERFARDLEVFAVASGETLPRPSRDLAIAVLGSMQGLAMMQVAGVVTVDESIYVTAAQGAIA